MMNGLFTAFHRAKYWASFFHTERRSWLERAQVKRRGPRHRCLSIGLEPPECEALVLVCSCMALHFSFALLLLVMVQARRAQVFLAPSFLPFRG
ncbi:unnamed protein product, partial [Musa acuminata var. zebrina]